jgi:cytoskeleton protein RodZ
LDSNVVGVAAMVPKAQSESSLEKPAVPFAEQPIVVSSGDAVQPFLLQLVAARNSWVEIYDVAGAPRLRRMLSSGETVSFEKAKGWSVVVGNADATDVFVGGQKYDVLTISKNNVARFTVK